MDLLTKCEKVTFRHADDFFGDVLCQDNETGHNLHVPMDDLITLVGKWKLFQEAERMKSIRPRDAILFGCNRERTGPC